LALVNGFARLPRTFQVLAMTEERWLRRTPSCHCEERSDEAISLTARDCDASLVMAGGEVAGRQTKRE